MNTDQREPEQFFTIREPAGPVEIKEKDSRFISFIHPIETKGDAESILNRLRKEFHDSTHICFAYRLGQGKEDSFRYNDDGEPSGTAGIPIYNEIKSAEYFNVLIAVVRYFGGTKLGTGGLARAYGRSAGRAVEKSEKITVWKTREFACFYPYDFTGDIMHAVNNFSLKILSQEYINDGVIAKFLVPVARFNEVKRILMDKSGGRIRFYDLQSEIV
ncbi:MAG: YigZ family protein [Deltaproteobacteria bacterium]|nr:YigZ family protein [Deltaproteobacteria bacterium]